MAADFDFTIIGGGVIGLAIARSLAPHGTVLLLEKHDLFGSETSSRNSEVIHAGFYYPSGSLKESLCIRGRHMLYHYCEQNGVPHQRIGKLIVAPDESHPDLLRLQQKASHLGIRHELLGREQLKALEPGVKGGAALLSPETGIIDSHSYMECLALDAERNGAILMKQTKFERASVSGGVWQLELLTADGPYEVSSEHLINAAGLQSHKVALACGTPAASMPELFYCRGHYFSLQGQSPFNHLIYPLPEENLAGLGIHATLDLGGQVRFGPDTEYLDTTETDYRVKPSLRDRFAEAVRRYYPALQDSQIQPAYAGIRPKLHGPETSPADFHIALDDRQDCPPLCHLMGIESPGLTASLAIADEVRQRLLGT